MEYEKLSRVMGRVQGDLMVFLHEHSWGEVTIRFQDGRITLLETRTQEKPESCNFINQIKEPSIKA